MSDYHFIEVHALYLHETASEASKPEKVMISVNQIITFWAHERGTMIDVVEKKNLILATESYQEIKDKLGL